MISFSYRNESLKHTQIILEKVKPFPTQKFYPDLRKLKNKENCTQFKNNTKMETKNKMMKSRKND
jgi:hypothetical protein